MTLLGGFEVSLDGKVATFRTRKTAALFAYLAYYAGKQLSKEVLSEAFWPDSDTDRARHSLRMALSSIRSSLETLGTSQTILGSDYTHVWLDARALSVDALQFRQAASNGEWAEAVHAYGGNLLPGCAEDWVVSQMLELEETFAQSLGAFVEAECGRGNVSEALTAATRALAMYSNREDIHLAVIRCHATAGNSGLAIRQFEVLERMLDELWGETPSAEAYGVLESLPRGSEPQAQPEASKPMKSPLEAPGAFFGRVDEIGQLRALLDPARAGPRLITLTGLGGTGKTRLAEQTCRGLSEAYANRAWFLALESAKTVAEVVDRLAAAVGSQDRSLSAIGKKIGREPALIVLDNLEQLIPKVRDLLEELSTHCPDLRILSTSRIPTGAPGESVVSVGPLPVPQGFQDLEQLRSNPSVQILVDSAQHVRLGFAVTALNSRSVYELCHRLEGIPLALELGASQLAFKTPAQVLGSLGRRVDLPVTRPHSDRHGSIAAIIDWSVDQLDEPCAAAFAALGVCQGGFTLELAQAILGPMTEACLSEMNRASLVSWQESAAEVRFSMLETVREVATARLAADPDLLKQATEAHFGYVESLVCRDLAAMTPDAQEHWGDAIDRERANIVSALENAAAGEIESSRAWALVQSLQEHMLRRGHFHRWFAPLQALLESTEARLSQRDAAVANDILARVAYGQRDISSTYRYWRKGIEFADVAGDDVLRAKVRSVFANAAALYGHYEQAKSEVETAIALLLDLEESALLARSYLVLGWLLFDEGHADEALEPFRNAVTLAEASGDPTVLGSSLTGFACATATTNYPEAAKAFDRAVSILRQEHRPEGLASSLYNRGLIEHKCGRYDEARANIQASFQIFVKHEIRLGQTPLMVAGNIFSALGELPEAKACWIRSELARRRHRMAMFPVLRVEFDRELARHGLNEMALWADLDSIEAESDEEFLQRLFLAPVRV